MSIPFVKPPPSATAPFVRIVEVGPRDGLQNEQRPISTADKISLINALADCGLHTIEATAFVSPRWVPQMADHDLVMRQVPRRPDLMLSALVPNETGARAAIAAGAQGLAVFASASESFAQKNTNCSIAESLHRFAPVMELAHEQGLPVRGYISCAIDCPFEGKINPDAVSRVAEALRKLGCTEIAVSDTLGRARPEAVAQMLKSVKQIIDDHQIAGHYHDTAKGALENVAVSLEMGVRIFDASIGGLGGCPYAPGAAGNLRTGHLVAFLEEQGFKTGIDQARLTPLEQQVLDWKSGTTPDLISLKFN
jgi:hydroxymethylglutaryl-CoA lyase